MIVKFLKKSPNFGAVRYSTNKVDNDKGELLLVKNFGALLGIQNLRPQDYINYLEALTAINSRIKFPQLHITISTKGKSHDKNQLAVIADKWMEGMGYGEQPYLLIYHKDTANNHIHIVSTRVGRNGKKIADSYEKIRAYKILNEITGELEILKTQKAIQLALKYNFSTLAQFKLLLETHGCKLVDDGKKYKICKYGNTQHIVDTAIIDQKIAVSLKNKNRIFQLRQILNKYSDKYDISLNKGRNGYTSEFTEYLKQKHGIELIFHAKGNHPPYGYTLIDHKQKAVFKGSDIYPLSKIIVKENLSAIESNSTELNTSVFEKSLSQDTLIYNTKNRKDTEIDFSIDQRPVNPNTSEEIFIPLLDIQIADDIDDEAILGRNRRKKKKVQTNTR